MLRSDMRRVGEDSRCLMFFSLFDLVHPVTMSAVKPAQTLHCSHSAPINGKPSIESGRESGADVRVKGISFRGYM
jgi:hypothetical protein